MDPKYWAYVWAWESYPGGPPGRKGLRVLLAHHGSRRGRVRVTFEDGLSAEVPCCGLRRVGAGKQTEINVEDV
jgi:hypothetical protein